MTGGIEAAADAVAGGVFAHAVEPHAGEHRGEHDSGRAHGLCRNCGTALIGEHCHACGQTGHVHRTIGAIGHDIAHGVFHFEGKAWRTFPMLAFHPGQLTRRYIDGERARFVSPMALFLFSVFLMFAIVASLPLVHIGDGDFMKGGVASRAAETRIELGKQRKETLDDAASTARDLTEEKADPDPDPARIDRLAAKLAGEQALGRQVAAAEQALPAGDATEIDNDRVTFKGPNANWVAAKWKHAKANPQLLLYKVKSSAYKYSWALIPLSVPFLWVLFPFSRRFGLYDHAVFVTYSLTFMSLLATVLAILIAIGMPWPAALTAFMLLAPIHIYKQLRGSYMLGRFGASLRLVLLLGAITWIVVPAFALALVYLGVAD